MRTSLSIIALLSLGATACTTNDLSQPPVEQALSQPFKDLSLLREETPELLKDAGKAPYRSLETCSAIQSEIRQINTLLGPDLDSGADAEGITAANVLSQLIGGVVDIPFRGVIRHVTGAAKRDQEKAEAIVAAVARRGYLRGVSAERRCDAADSTAAVTGAAAEAAAPPPAVPDILPAVTSPVQAPQPITPAAPAASSPPA